MLAKVDSEITLEGLSLEEIRAIRSSLTFPNPDYEKKIKAGRWVGNTPRNLELSKRVGDSLVVPFGVLSALSEMGGVKFEASEHMLDMQLVVPPAVVLGLYDYQEEAVRAAIKRKNGVIVSPCGSGKTQIGISILARMGVRTLWLTHTHDLLKQSMDRAKSLLDLKKGDIGTITGGKIDVGNFITFATVQTMAKIDLAPFKNTWSLIIVDECHKAVGSPTRLTMFWKVISSLSARMKIGLTATPNRADGLAGTMYALLGKKICEISREQVKSTTCPLVWSMIDTHWEPDFDKIVGPDGVLSYTKLVTECVCDEERNQKIATTIKTQEGPVLVLSERVAHLEYLKELAGEGICLSSSKKSERENAIEKIKSGKERVLFATYQLAKEGLDIPCLEHLVMATPIKDETAIVQSVGRVLRKHEKKFCGMVWDFRDSMIMLNRWAKKRERIYGRLQKDA